MSCELILNIKWELFDDMKYKTLIKIFRWICLNQDEPRRAKLLRSKFDQKTFANVLLTNELKKGYLPHNFRAYDNLRCLLINYGTVYKFDKLE